MPKARNCHLRQSNIFCGSKLLFMTKQMNSRVIDDHLYVLAPPSQHCSAVLDLFDCFQAPEHRT